MWIIRFVLGSDAEVCPGKHIPSVMWWYYWIRWLKKLKVPNYTLFRIFIFQQSIDQHTLFKASASIINLSCVWIHSFIFLDFRCGITVFSGCSVAAANASPQAEFTSSKDSEFQRHITSLPLYPDSYFLRLLLTIANTVALLTSHRAEGATRGLAGKTLLQSLTFPDTTDYFSQCLVFFANYIIYYLIRTMLTLKPGMLSDIIESLCLNEFRCLLSLQREGAMTDG